MTDMHDNNEEYKKGFDFKLWKKVFRYIAGYRKLSLLLIAVMITLAGTDAVMPLMTRYAIDNFVAEKTTEYITVFILVYLGLSIIKAITIFLLIYLAEKLMVNISHDIRKEGFIKLQQLSFTFYDHNAVGNLVARLTSDTRRLTGIISWGLVDVTWAISLLAMISVIMFTLNSKIALIVLGVLPLLLFVSIKFQKLILKASREARKNNAIIISSFNEGIQGATTTKTLVREEINLQEFDDKAMKLRTSAIKVAIYSALFFPIVTAISTLGTSLALWQGGIMVLGSAMTLGTLTAFMAYTVQFFMPVNDLASIMAEMQSAQAAGERIMSLLETDAKIKDSDEVIAEYGIVNPSDEVPKLEGRIQFKDVSFQYKDGEKVLDNFNLDVTPGETIAIIGETGSGKTTIANLACRFYQPTEGQILIDGNDYKDIPLMHIHGNLGYMLQTPHLFSGTIRENIKYGKLDSTDEQIEEVAKLVKAHEFISGFDKGYDHVVSQGGGGLSTGQKQLICIARAIIADPSIFILDEATSSVDTHTERIIQEAIATVIAGRTSFVIAHRLSTIRQADRILVLEKGIIVEQGTHSELIKNTGRYYNLYTSQFLEEHEVEVLND
ncbi:MAG: ABC transporter ATP-binding protein [Clostridiales bacterium]|nr:ABC transporter ATP-binding protein [Clostridiales bacterium]